LGNPKYPVFLRVPKFKPEVQFFITE